MITQQGPITGQLTGNQGPGSPQRREISPSTAAVFVVNYPRQAEVVASDLHDLYGARPVRPPAVTDRFAGRRLLDATTKGPSEEVQEMRGTHCQVPRGIADRAPTVGWSDFSARECHADADANHRQATDTTHGFHSAWRLGEPVSGTTRSDRPNAVADHRNQWKHHS